MYMAWHDDPCIYFETLILLTKLPALHDNIAVLSSCKYIDPVNNGIADEVQLIGITKLVFSAHALIYHYRTEMGSEFD